MYDTFLHDTKCLGMKKSLQKWEKHLIKKSKWKSVISPRRLLFRKIEADCDIAWWFKFKRWGRTELLAFHNIFTSRSNTQRWWNFRKVLSKAASENTICLSTIKKVLGLFKYLQKHTHKFLHFSQNFEMCIVCVFLNIFTRKHSSRVADGWVF